MVSNKRLHPFGLGSHHLARAHDSGLQDHSLDDELLRQQLLDIREFLLDARTDAREGLIGLRRLEEKLDSLADAFATSTAERLNPGYRHNSDDTSSPRADIAARETSPSSLKNGSQTRHCVPGPSQATSPRADPEIEARDSEACDNVENDHDNDHNQDVKSKIPEIIADRAMQIQQLDRLENQIASIARTVGAPLLQQVSAGDDNEDRKRLKEKLKEALESDRRGRLRQIMSERQRWAEYVFGICSPDRRNGKRGNRYKAGFIDMNAIDFLNLLSGLFAVQAYSPELPLCSRCVKTLEKCLQD